MKLSYRWKLKDSTFRKDKGTVFSTFAGGGGSSMGYKLAGFNVIGCNEIDKRMINCYIENLHPKYAFLEPIQTFKLRNDLPPELYNLDILDGSPPCSSFTNAGNRSKDWGKEKVFMEGQAQQVLDTLFFDFIDLAKKLQPKIVLAENVPGIKFGEAIKYVQRIHKEFDLAGFYSHHWILDASKMGVPQKRKRVFFIAMRKDLAKFFDETITMTNPLPKLNLKFSEPEIKVKEILMQIGDDLEMTELMQGRWKKTKIGKYVKKYQTGNLKLVPNEVCPAISTVPPFHPYEMRRLVKKEVALASSFPTDYKFLGMNWCNVMGMSVPPLMVARVATEIYNQWLKQIK